MSGLGRLAVVGCALLVAAVVSGAGAGDGAGPRAGSAAAGTSGAAAQAPDPAPGAAAPGPLADAPPPEAVLADLPFLAAADGYTSEVRIDLAAPGSRALPLLVDTGSPESFATPLAAQAIGISVRRSKETPYRRATRLGRDVRISVDTRHGDMAASRSGEWAVLGGRFLTSYVLEVDLPRRRVRFLDPARYAVPERPAARNESVLPFRLDLFRPVIDIRVGDVLVPAIVSTGAPGTLLLPGGFAAGASLGPDPDAPAALPAMPGAGKVAAATAARVRIGRFVQPDVPLLVAERGAQGAGPRSDAILGTGLLARFVVRIDYPRRRLWIATPPP